MAELKYVKGDATQPQGDGTKVIIHIVNDKGHWGRGFVVALREVWPETEDQYRKHWHEMRLGDNQQLQVADDIWVVNMMAQHDTRAYGWRPPIRYGALSKCLRLLAMDIHNSTDLENVSIHAPRFGAGLAGGHWGFIESLIYEHLIDEGIDVTIYDLE